MPDSVNITMNFVANTAVFGDINQRLNVVSNHVKNVTNQFTQVSNRVNNVTNNVNHLGDNMDRLSSVSSGIGGFFRKLGNFGMGAAGIITTFNAVTGKMKEFAEANRAQQEAEAKLAQVMRNTMGASAAEVQSIKDLAAAQQQLGVIGDEVQLAGAQELGTYLEKSESLKRLMPVMNDMLAQQYGLNASQEQATQIASMMGKVMEGQVGALSRYGYKFDEAQEKILKFGTEEQKAATLAEVIEQSVGGMNAALAATPEGQLQQAANRMGDIKEQVGAIWVKIQSALMPAVNGLLRMAEGLVAAVQAGWPVWVAAAIAAVVAIAKINNELHKVDGGLAQTTLGAILTGGGFKAMAAIAKSACRSISVAIMNIPIVGWIAAAITLIIGIFQQLWTKCEAFRGFLTGVWEVIKNTFHNLIEIVRPIITQIIATIRNIIQSVVERVRAIIAWFRSIFAKVGTWFKGVMQPVWNWFANLWEHIKSIFGKVVEFMGRVFNPIITLWNRLTKGNVEKFKTGYQQGAQAVREDKKQSGIAPVAQFGEGASGGLGTETNTKAAGAAETAVTGGTRNTQITINLGKMVENINFNGTLQDNIAAMQQQVEEALLRTLYAAQSAAV